MVFPKPLAHRARLPLGTLILLLAVFGWGLEYKTSLYQDQQSNLHSKSQPPAKLLSEAERNVSSKRMVSFAGLIGGVKIATPDLLATGNSVEQARCVSELCLPPQETAPRRSSSTKYFIRPPPLS